MASKIPIKNEAVFLKLKILSNRFRFKILELTENKKVNLTELSSLLKLSYTKCADYVTMLEKQGLIEKEQEGTKVFVTSKIKIQNNSISF